MSQRGLLSKKYKIFLKKVIIEFDWAKWKLQVILSTPVRIDGEEPSFSISLLLLRYSSINGQISGFCLFRAALRYSFLSSVSLAEMEPNPLRLLSDSVLWCLPVSWLKGSLSMQRRALFWMDCNLLRFWLETKGKIKKL